VDADRRRRFFVEPRRDETRCRSAGRAAGAEDGAHHVRCLYLRDSAPTYDVMDALKLTRLVSLRVTSSVCPRPRLNRLTTNYLAQCNPCGRRAILRTTLTKAIRAGSTYKTLKTSLYITGNLPIFPISSFFYAK